MRAAAARARRWCACLLAAVGAAGLAQPPAAPAPALPPGVDRDVACMLLMWAGAQPLLAGQATLDAERREALRVMRETYAYFAGRVGSRHQPGAIGPLVAAARRGLPRAQYRTMGQACLRDGDARLRATSDEAAAALRQAEPPAAPAVPRL